jgi:hypothetical protein
MSSACCALPFSPRLCSITHDLLSQCLRVPQDCAGGTGYTRCWVSGSMGRLTCDMVGSCLNMSSITCAPCGPMRSSHSASRSQHLASPRHGCDAKHAHSRLWPRRQLPPLARPRWLSAATTDAPTGQKWRRTLSRQHGQQQSRRSPQDLKLQFESVCHTGGCTRTSQRCPSGQADASMKVAVATLAMRNGYRTRPLVRLRKHTK